MPTVDQSRDVHASRALEDDLFDLESEAGGFPIKRAIAALAVLVALGGAAAWWFGSQRAAPAPTYATIPAARGNLSVGVSATGPIAAATTVPLAFKTNGQVREVLVEVGQRVSGGQALARLDTADLERAVEQARAQLEQQIGALAKLEQGPTREAVATTQSQVEGGSVNLANAQASLAAARAAADAEARVAEAGVLGAEAAARDVAALLESSLAQANAARQADAQAIARAERVLQDAATQVDATRAEGAAVLAAERSAVANAEVALESARKALATAQQQFDAAAAVDAANVASAETAVANTRKAFDRVQQLTGTSQGVQQAQIDKANQDIATAEATRDAICDSSASTPAQCESARANVEQARAALEVVRTTTRQTSAQNLQALQASQAQLDQAQAELRATQAVRDANRARNLEAVQGAQAQVDSAVGALNVARDGLRTTEARQQSALQASQQHANDALSALQIAQATSDANAQRDAHASAQAEQAASQARAAEQTARAQATQTAARTASNVQTAQMQADQAASQLATLQAQLDELAAPPTDADLAAARAAVLAARVVLEQAQADLSAGTLVAPLDGTVAQIHGVVGQQVSSGQGSASGASSGSSGSPFVTLANLDRVQVQAQVNESDMAGIASGKPITFSVGAYPSATFTGSVLSVQPLANQSQNVVTYTVLCSVDPTELPLLPGMTASVTLVTESRTDVLLVPSSALQFAQSQGAPPGSVLVLVNGASTRRAVQIGLSDGRFTEIVSGVEPGELVITGQTSGG